MLSRLLVWSCYAVCLYCCCFCAQASVIRDVSSSQVQTQIDKINSLRDQGKPDQAESMALVLLERARAENKPLDMAAAFYEIGHIASMQNKYDLALRTFNNALDIYTSEARLPQIAVILAEIGTTYRYQSSYTDALNYLYRALTLYQSLNDEAGVAAQQLDIGIVLKELGQFEPALASLQAALKSLRMRNDQGSISQCLSHIGDIYADMGQFSEAQTYLQDALEIAQQQGISQRIAKAHSRLGSLFLTMQRYNDARTHLNKALALFDELEAPLDHDWTLTSLGQVELAMGDTQAGLNTLNQALLRAQQSEFDSLLTHIHLALAQAFIQLADYKTALLHIDKGLSSAKEREELNRQVEFLDLKVTIFESQQRFQDALTTLHQRNKVQKQILDKSSALALSRIQSEIEVERQAQSIEMLRKNKAIELAEADQRNLRTTLFLGSLVAVMLFIFLLWSRYVQRRRNAYLKREVRIRTQELEEKNTQLEEAYHTLEQVSLRDPLTGLYNRHFLEAQLPGELKRSQYAFENSVDPLQQDNADLLVFLLDIDNFKRINDEYGHLAGDRFLVQFTKIIHQVFRQTDLLIRWGGEEFLVVCRNTNRHEITGLAERFREAVKYHVFNLQDNITLSATCSIGFCAFPLYRDNASKLDWHKTFAITDYCLYAAKLSGRDAWVGLKDAQESNRVTAPDALYHKFGLTEVEVATSLNNLASISWPDN